MHRRAFVRWAGGLLAIASCGRVVSSEAVRQPTDRGALLARWRGRIRSFLAKEVVPIIDTEATYNRAIDIDYFVGQMDQAGVALVCFAPHGSLGSEYSLRLHREHPGHFVPTTTDGSSPHWYHNTEAFVAQTRQDLQTGNYFLMGEFEIRHYPSHAQVLAGQWNRDVTVPIDSSAVHKLFQLGVETGIAFQIHYESEDALLPPLEWMLERYPRAKVIWCHLGQIRFPDRSKIYGPAYVRSLIERFPGLHFDLGHTGPGHIYPGNGQRDQTIYQRTGVPPYGWILHSDWKKLIEDHPERFIASSDTDAGRYRDLGEKIVRMRNVVFDHLSLRARHLVAYQNAWRLLSGESWRS
ncbi:MAG: hypothetical protein OEZ08_10055 [Betaproteobacteria bacterium]|nr:hypothetical protein [Betaproteobacteria bacterium]